MSMWRCPVCGRDFANRSQTHYSPPLGDLEAHFGGCAAPVRETFDRILAVLNELGPVTVLAEKTRIALQVRMSVAAVAPRPTSTPSSPAGWPRRTGWASNVTCAH
ncbi:MAG TPA: hypothetical protein VFU35_08670 [Jatrophihabitans sp.]|nr:hypothetical protein [Jatrophihabitans sp.]